MQANQKPTLSIVNVIFRRRHKPGDLDHIVGSSLPRSPYMDVQCLVSELELLLHHQRSRSRCPGKPVLGAGCVLRPERIDNPSSPLAEDFPVGSRVE